MGVGFLSKKFELIFWGVVAKMKVEFQRFSKRFLVHIIITSGLDATADSGPTEIFQKPLSFELRVYFQREL